jgi:hypothetical protein
MNIDRLQPLALPDPSPAMRFSSAIATTARAVSRVASLMWRSYRLRSEETRAAAAIGELSPHVLRDIGASNELLAHVHERRSISFPLWSLVAAAILTVTVAPVSAADDGHLQTAKRASAPQQTVGVPSGELQGGTPVYRLPSIEVVGSRKAELVKAAREDAARTTSSRRPSNADGRRAHRAALSAPPEERQIEPRRAVDQELRQRLANDGRELEAVT